MILEKMSSWIWKSGTYEWIHLLGPSAPNVVSRSQVPRSIDFLRFHKFIGFISWFLRKWGLVCENWGQGSGLMAGYVFWAQANCPKLVFRPQTPNVRALESENFCVKLHKILHQISFYFQILGHFSQSYECLFPENCKKNLSKIFFLVPFQICNFPLSLVKNTPVFWSTKFQISPELPCQIKKWAHSEILSLRALKWCKNKIILIKFQFWMKSLLLTFCLDLFLTVFS